MIKAINGVEIPTIGLGTLVEGIDEDRQVENIVFAVNQGFKMLDTAWSYGNEVIVGKAIASLINSGFKREDLFIQTKFYPQMPYDYEKVILQFEDSLTKLGLDYVDSYLFHQPVPRYSELEYQSRNSDAWRAFEHLYSEGKARVIGVSNFLERHIEYIAETASIYPMINQLEINPFFQQRGLSGWCRHHNIVVQSWGPLSKGSIIGSELINSLAKKYEVSVGQICLKWNMQMGNVPIVASTKQENILSNLKMDFSISDEDMEIIRSCNTSTQHRDTWWYPRQQMY